jgi:hypothetical protein
MILKQCRNYIELLKWEGSFTNSARLKTCHDFADDSITDQKERAKIFGQYDHVRIYGRDYFDKLRSIGLE